MKMLIYQLVLTIIVSSFVIGTCGCTKRGPGSLGKPTAGYCSKAGDFDFYSRKVSEADRCPSEKGRD